jgi:peptide/nickel transport system substrate-binding protein
MRNLALGGLAALTLSLGAAAPATAATPTVGWTSFPDYVDPAIGYTQEAWNVTWATYTPLLTYAHAEGQAGLQLVPGLAEALPQVSPDGRTYTLTLRAGLKYSNGRAVKAGDFEHAIKRVLHLESGGSAFFLGIRGAERYLKRGRAGGDISGISARGRTITIRLDRADPAFPHELAMQFAALVPSSTPFRNMTRRPPAGVGPFRIARVRVGRSIELRRNARFAVPGLPQAKLPAIRYVATRRPQTADVTTEVEGRGGRPIPTISTYYMFLNTTTKPFDDEQVRRAVHMGLDKPALIRAGGVAMRPGCTFLPPELLGAARAAEPCPFGDPAAPPAQREQAKAQIAAAGAAGAKVSVYTNRESPARQLGTEYARQLRDLGLDARVKIVDPAAYFQTIGTDRRKAQTGFANWFLDFPHPLNFLFLVDPRSNQATNNQNFSRNRDQAIAAAIDQGRYDDADRIAVDKGYVVPYGHRQLSVLSSKRVGCVVAHPLYQVDLAQLCAG